MASLIDCLIIQFNSLASSCTHSSNLLLPPCSTRNILNSIIIRPPPQKKNKKNKNSTQLNYSLGWAEAWGDYFWIGFLGSQPWSLHSHPLPCITYSSILRDPPAHDEGFFFWLIVYALGEHDSLHALRSSNIIVFAYGPLSIWAYTCMHVWTAAHRIIHAGTCTH
jgi:hypothetical protein